MSASKLVQSQVKKKIINIYSYILCKTAHIHMLHQVELCSNDVHISAM